MKPVCELLIRTVLVLLVSIPASAAHTIDSTFATEGITIDGLAEDWEDSPVVYLEESLRVVSVNHDDEYMYVMYRFGDARLAGQLMHRGVVLWINGDGKKKNKNDAFGVRYTGSEEIKSSLEATRSEGDLSTEVRRSDRGGMTPPAEDSAMRPEPDELVVIENGSKETISSDQETGYQAASTVIDDKYIYELRIPLAEIGGKVAELPPTKQRSVAIGIQIGGLTDAERELIKGTMAQEREQRGGSGGGMSGGGRGMGGGMGGPSRGGRGMGGPPGGGGERPSLDPEIDWLVAELNPDP